jgi:hypothetical protein
VSFITNATLKVIKNIYFLSYKHAKLIIPIPVSEDGGKSFSEILVATLNGVTVMTTTI